MPGLMDSDWLSAALRGGLLSGGAYPAVNQPPSAGLMRLLDKQPGRGVPMNYGRREDGTQKGNGYFGRLPMREPNQYATELSANETVNGKDLFFPLIVPTLSKAELDLLLSGGDPTNAIYDKAVSHALDRKARGADPFAGRNDGLYAMPK